MLSQEERELSSRILEALYQTGDMPEGLDPGLLLAKWEQRSVEHFAIGDGEWKDAAGFFVAVAGVYYAEMQNDKAKLALRELDEYVGRTRNTAETKEETEILIERELLRIGLGTRELPVQLFDESEQLLERLLRDTPRPSFHVRFWHYRCIAAYYKQKNYEVIDHALQALRYVDENTPIRMVLRIYTNLTTMYQIVGRLNDALRYAIEHYSLARNKGSQRELALAELQLAGLYQALDKVDDAERHVESSAELYKAVGDKIGEAEAISRLGQVRIDQRRYDEALELLSQALVIHQASSNVGGMAACLGNKAIIWMRLEEYDRAERTYLDLVDLCRSHCLAALEANTKVNLGDMYLQKTFARRDIKKAAELFHEALSLYDGLRMQSKVANCYDYLSLIYAELEDWKQAYRTKQLQIELIASSGIEEAKRSATEYEQSLNAAKAQAAADARLAEQQRLLHTVLPASVADRLIAGERVADYFPHISILFADIVGFTSLASRMPAKAVLSLLNNVFGLFDRIMRAEGCEKIKTIGDGYMAVCGAPDACVDHAERLSRAALLMQVALQSDAIIQNLAPQGTAISIRIGLHCGSAFAGVVGEDRYVYDVYSDAVNLAARMQSTGLPGKIHCSADFAHHLQNRDESFILEERGEIEVKGKGTMRTYFLSPERAK